MRIDDSGHSVDLEVLVGSNMRHGFDWTPVGERWLSIIEPLVAKLLDMVVVNMSNSGSDLTSWESSAQEEHVLSNISVN